ncbi:hypothetical protein KUM39_19465 [Streptomyces sp. J2-1]|uniref:hypothetical protein n=1 Tax=Streptomyces corallincola TaxID=2851888 RepID=UPI001C391279|nr:hypothetical protein [Streptomyces corallincola]MBV2356530.1 hypothetical protein [Streptomyces corallincola]
MTHNTPLSPRPLRHLPDVHRSVLTAAQLRAHGVSTAELTERCRPEGPWRFLLPQVVLLHSRTPSAEERLRGALLYTARESTPGVPVQPGAGEPHRQVYVDAVLTGPAALALYGFSAVPSLADTERVDVLVPRTRRLRPSGYVRVVRTADLPVPCAVRGLPVAPVERAVADTVAELTDANEVRGLLTEAVSGGHCEPASVVRELTAARLLSRQHVVDAVDALLAEGRSVAEDRLYRMVVEHGLPDPVWNVDLRLPGGPHLGGLDAYWPEQAVAVELDTRAPRQDEDALWSEYARKREHLERLGITVVHLTPKKLREAMEQQAAVVRTALMAAGDRDPAAYVVVLPR